MNTRAPVAVREADPIVVAADELLAGAVGFLLLLTDEEYAASNHAIGGSTIGGHVRHVLDHFAAALAGLNASDEAGVRERSVGVIDYDHRVRGTSVENSRLAALDAIAEVRARLRAVGDGEGTRPVRVRVMLHADGRCAELGSTFGRELAFATHHAIHHQAMIAIAARALGVATPAGFDKAPSTVEHEAQAH